MSVQWRLIDGMDVYCIDPRGYTDLMSAIMNSRNEVVKTLLAEPGCDKCDINQQNRENYTALHYACISNNSEAVTALISDSRLTTLNTQGKSGKSPIMEAVCNNNLEIVKMMLEVPGVDLLLMDNEGRSIVELASGPEMNHLLESRLPSLLSKGN